MQVGGPLMQLRILTSSYQRAIPAVSPSIAQKEARQSESTAYKEALSREDYEQKCESLVRTYHLGVADNSRQIEGETTTAQSAPAPGGIIIGKYTNAVHHRHGLFSTVYKATVPYPASKTMDPGALVALKVSTPLNMTAPHNTELECRILHQARSTHIIPLLEHFLQPGGRWVLVFPFMSHDLEHLLERGPLPHKQAQSVLHNLFSGLAHLHSLNIIHRDVKPSNILLVSPSGPAYIADFGIAWSATESTLESSNCKITDVGTTSYMPPELLFGNKRYDCSLDLWAAGCVAAQVVSLGEATLFDSGDLGSELALILSVFRTLGTPTLEVWPEAARFPDWGKMQFHDFPRREWDIILPTASESARDMVATLVRYESGQRLTAAEALKHPYFHS
ncbi:hypothetical protein B0A49_02510 [Cryomyces minteri]|uniref:cyclin-dependent kinase n=1 Tax=Cryomyces minteri TaxID=331657 RepID=A0A4U0XL43_9PEZI|nr:hypothetical protein B0A49_02510 [Cryomyces minteri]